MSERILTAQQKLSQGVQRLESMVRQDPGNEMAARYAALAAIGIHLIDELKSIDHTIDLNPFNTLNKLAWKKLKQSNELIQSIDAILENAQG